MKKINHSELYEKYGHLNKAELNDILIEVSEAGDVEDARYILTSPELTIHADIHHKDDCYIRWACYKGRLELLKFYLTSPELKEHSNIHAQNDESFALACRRSQLDVVQYLIFDYNIPQTEDITKFLVEVKDDKILGWFKIRDINNKLIAELPTNNDTGKKAKL